MRLELRDCTKAFVGRGGSRTVLDRATAAFESGSTYAILGPSASGKSTLLNLLGLLTDPTAGEYLIDGMPTSSLSERARSELRAERFGFVFQDFALAARKTALENVMLPLVFANRSAYRRRRERALELLCRVGLEEHAHLRAWELSGGQQQRVAIARALACQPVMLLADEPTGSLDQRTGAETMGLLLELVRERGLGLVLVTHDPMVAGAVDHRLALAGGRLRAAAAHGFLEAAAT
jgi:putative ABC transport system ATP-binding protein